MSYEQWSEQVREQLRRPELQALAASWLAPEWQADQGFEERPVAQLAERYTDYLHACKQELGLHLIQPGRFVLPGEYAGAPMLQFVPWVWAMPVGEPAEGTLYATLKQRFEQYKQHLVQGFYEQHFAGFDRQIVLVDCLQPLNAGAASFGDMQQAIARIMESFAYGKSNWWRRLFSPRIDKLLFVASKADHVTPNSTAPWFPCCSIWCAAAAVRPVLRGLLPSVWRWPPSRRPRWARGGRWPRVSRHPWHQPER